MNPREEYKKLLTELKALQEQMKTETFTPEQLSDVQAKMARAKELKASVDDLDALQAEYATYGADFDRLQSRGSVTRHDRECHEDPNASQGGRNGDGGQSRQAYQRLGEYITKQEAYQKRINNKFSVELPGIWMPGANYAMQPFERLQVARGFDRYALTAGGGLSIPLEVRPGTPTIAPILSVRPTVRDALSNQNTTFNLVPFIREDLDAEDNNAAFFDADGTNVKPESAAGVIDDEAPIRTIATTFRVSEAMLDDVTALRNFIEAKLIDFLRQAEDDALLNGTGTPPEIKGIREMDIQVLDGTYFSSNAVAGVGTIREDIDRLQAGMTSIRETGRAEPSAVVLSPKTWDWFISSTNTNGDYYAGNPFTTTDLTRFRGVAIVVSNKMSDGKGLMLDGRYFTVYDRQVAKVDAGYVDKDFAQNHITLRAEERIGLAGERPAAAAEISFVHAGV